MLWRTARIVCLAAISVWAATRASAQAPMAGVMKDVYTYLYPLVATGLARRGVALGRFEHQRSLGDGQGSPFEVPDGDCLSSVAWLDVSTEPYVLAIPDARDRYFVMPMIDAWSNVFASPGKRTSGTRAQTYVITGPGWRGELPKGTTQVKAPTAIVWIHGRVASTGTREDLDRAHAFQDGLILVPLREYGIAPGAPHGTAAAPTNGRRPQARSLREEIDRLDAPSFFQIAASLLAQNSPAPADLPLMRQHLAEVGITLGRPFDPSKLPSNADALIGNARRELEASAQRLGRHANGWTILTKGGAYGTRYDLRAAIAWLGLGADLPEDSVTAHSLLAADGRPYDGDSRFVLHFARSDLPPVSGPWSLGVYKVDGGELRSVDGPLGRRSLGSQEALVYNDDGSLDLYLQREAPGKGKDGNWMATPPGRFALVMRLYSPRSPVLDGIWVPQPVRKRERPTRAEIEAAPTL